MVHILNAYNYHCSLLLVVNRQWPPVSTFPAGPPGPVINPGQVLKVPAIPDI